MVTIQPISHITNIMNNTHQIVQCPFCSEDIRAGAIKCKHCGSDIEYEEEYRGKVKANMHQSYWSFSILSILLPIVGIILGIVYLTKSSRLDKKLGEHTLAMSVLFMIIWGVVFGISLAVSINNSQLENDRRNEQVIRESNEMYEEMMRETEALMQGY